MQNSCSNVEILEILTSECSSRRNIPCASSAAKVTGAIQKVSLWAGDSSGSDSLPHFHHPPLQLAPPLVFSSSSPSLHTDSQTSVPPALHTAVCTDLTSLTWLWLGRLLLTSLCRELFPGAPRLTGIHSCSSATSNQSLSRKEFYSSHSWEQLPVRSETNKKTTLKATFNQITTEAHTTGCRDPSAWLLIATAQLKWHICKASTSLCALIDSQNWFIISDKAKLQLFLVHHILHLQYLAVFAYILLIIRLNNITLQSKNLCTWILHCLITKNFGKQRTQRTLYTPWKWFKTLYWSHVQETVTWKHVEFAVYLLSTKLILERILTISVH